jgi:hypothetical protein
MHRDLRIGIDALHLHADEVVRDRCQARIDLERLDHLVEVL